MNINGYSAPPFEVRLATGYDVMESGCWEWNRARNADGYGFLRKDGKGILAHRAMLISIGREIPDGMQVDHLCRNRACVNPEHLEIVTPLENSLRGLSVFAINARKTHCIRGHEFTPENTYTYFSRSPDRSRPMRHCRTCGRENARKYYRKKREPEPAPAHDGGSAVGL